MRRDLLTAAISIALLPFGCALAQSIPPSTQADRTLRQGDIIEWSGVSGGDHQVRFGGTVGATTLTPVTEVDDYLGNFDPALKITSEVGVAPENGATGPLLTAKVLDAAQVDKTFNFTCGFHPADMLSRAFKIEAKVDGQAPRTFKITGVAGRHWILEKPDGTKVSIDTTPP
jgi:hypothetical protein